MDLRTQDELIYEIPDILRIYSDGRVDRLYDPDFVPATTDPKTHVTSKDIMITAPDDRDISARLFLPKLASPTQKLPVVLYFHGGAFCLCSPFTSPYHGWLNTLVSDANIIAVSVNYRKAPEHPIPAAYEDAWAALCWLSSHCGGGQEAWLNDHADFGRVFLGGVSAGGNIAHNLAMRAGELQSELSLNILGVALEHPYFWGSKAIGSESLDPGRKSITDRLWPIISPMKPGNDDPRINPVAEGALSLVGLGCRRVLVCVAEKDILKDRNWVYYRSVIESGWMGVAEIVESQGVDHGFHVFDLRLKRLRI